MEELDLSENAPKKQACIAHVKQIGDNWIEHSLEDHLRDVAKLTSQFASKFSSPEWGRLAGLWHDLGKFRPRFQSYIRDRSGYERENAHVEANDRPHHSTAGAIHAIRQLGDVYGHILAYLIAGHHAGLADWNGNRGSLSQRLGNSLEEYNESITSADQNELLNPALVPVVPPVASSVESIALWIRMLFSCLVDSDRLDTERFMNSDQHAQRGGWPSLGVLQQRFIAKMTELDNQKKGSALAKTRKDIYMQCLSAASWNPGLFSLTVPTGGGKTLSSLAFALEHALRFNKKRVIYSIPYTSIIEQNADVFRHFVGDDAVLEHHSNLDVAAGKENSQSILAAENWDAPLIVTTNVQLFESLHSAKTTRCRRLHNLIDSVIILDEAQQLPRDFHRPITRVMQQMADHFGVTWILCTATQPELARRENPFGQVVMQGLHNVREIIQRPQELADTLNERVQVRLPSHDEPRKTAQEIVSEIDQEEAVLCIVNSRRQAREFFQLLREQSNSFHLSAQMCANHRTEVIQEVKKRLLRRRDGDRTPLRVVSTQLIEAGVDVDFPVVYRAIAGMDSIAQAAGRCNRENRLLEPGKVVVFKPETSSFGFLRQGEDTTMELIAAGKVNIPLSPEVFAAYFRLMNSKGNSDLHDICKDLTAKHSKDAPLEISFRTAAKKFRMIDDSGVGVIVPFIPKGQDSSPIHGLLGKLEKDTSQRWIYRKLQRFSVTLPESAADEMIKQNCIRTIAGQMVLDDGYYHPTWGTSPPDTVLPATESVF